MSWKKGKKSKKNFFRSPTVFARKQMPGRKKKSNKMCVGKYENGRQFINNCIIKIMKYLLRF